MRPAYGLQLNSSKMKQKISFATTITTTVLFFILASVKNPFLFFAAFVLLLARGIYMFIEAINKNDNINETQPAANLPKLVTLKVMWQLAGIGFIACTLFVFFLKKDVWKQFL